jgi:hypothetical protein
VVTGRTAGTVGVRSSGSAGPLKPAATTPSTRPAPTAGRVRTTIPVHPPTSAAPVRPAASPVRPALAPARPPGPDLIVVSVSWTPVQPYDGDQVIFAAVVRNAGTTASPAITHGIGFLVDGVTVSWSGASAQPLAPGEQRTYVADESDAGPPCWTAVAGTHRFTAYADDIDRFPETDETNNTLTTTLTIR